MSKYETQAEHVDACVTQALAPLLFPTKALGINILIH